MSTDTPLGATSRGSNPSRSLATWIRDLVDAADLDPLGAGRRLRSIVSGWSALIALDDESIVVSMPTSGRLEIAPPTAITPTDGSGATTSRVVLALLDGQIELSDMIADGWIEVRGHRDAVTRLFHAVEILLDASARVPALRQLAVEFRHERGPTVPLPHRDIAAEQSDELVLLARLGLLEAPS